MKKLKQNSIEIHPMTEKPMQNFKYIWDNGIICPTKWSPSEFDFTHPALGWIQAQVIVIDELTFEELEIGEHFAADDPGGNRHNWIKVDGDVACRFDKKDLHKCSRCLPASDLTSIKRLKEIE